MILRAQYVSSAFKAANPALVTGKWKFVLQQRQWGTPCLASGEAGFAWSEEVPRWTPRWSFQHKWLYNSVSAFAQDQTGIHFSTSTQYRGLWGIPSTSMHLVTTGTLCNGAAPSSSPQLLALHSTSLCWSAWSLSPLVWVSLAPPRKSNKRVKEKRSSFRRIQEVNQRKGKYKYRREANLQLVAPAFILSILTYLQHPVGKWKTTQTPCCTGKALLSSPAILPLELPVNLLEQVPYPHWYPHPLPREGTMELCWRGLWSLLLAYHARPPLCVMSLMLGEIWHQRYSS